jgi:nitric oxide reductase NorD protein
VLTHNFEKVETADEFNGMWRDFDGDDSLGEHAEALQELDMKFVVRTDDPVHSVYQAAYAENASVGESAETKDTGPCICYDEWDYTKKDYRRQYAKLFPYRHTEKDPAYLRETLDQHRTILVQLRKLLASVHNKWQQQRLQQQGKEVDIDMAVDRYADIHAGHTPSEKIYISDRKHARDLTILILMDLSLSSDSYAAGNRVIDVEKQTCILFGEILHEYGIDFSVAGFYSRTRNHTAYLSIKDFDESWLNCRDRLGSLRPEGYTRIGSALRHSGSLLTQRDSGNQWLILLSDGKPNDFDRYEGRYGVHDIRQALRELHANSIQTYALAIEATARHYLPQMFGQDHFQIVSSPTALLTALIRLFERIRHGS